LGRHSRSKSVTVVGSTLSTMAEVDGSGFDAIRGREGGIGLEGLEVLWLRVLRSLDQLEDGSSISNQIVCSKIFD
jgi:hypothetical protein